MHTVERNHTEVIGLLKAAGAKESSKPDRNEEEVKTTVGTIVVATLVLVLASLYKASSANISQESLPQENADANSLFLRTAQGWPRENLQSQVQPCAQPNRRKLANGYKRRAYL